MSGRGKGKITTTTTTTTKQEDDNNNERKDDNNNNKEIEEEDDNKAKTTTTTTTKKKKKPLVILKAKPKTKSEKDKKKDDDNDDDDDDDDLNDLLHSPKSTKKKKRNIITAAGKKKTISSLLADDDDDNDANIEMKSLVPRGDDDDDTKDSDDDDDDDDDEKKKAKKKRSNKYDEPTTADLFHVAHVRIGALCTLITLICMSSKPCLLLGGFILLISVLMMYQTHHYEMALHHPHIVFGGNEGYYGQGVNSVYDLHLGQIDHWCIFGGDDGCSCDDPLEPVSHAEVHGWLNAHKLNKHMINEARGLVAKTDPITKKMTPTKIRDIDVLFFGDSITEEWNGRWLGRNYSRFNDIHKVFTDYFDTTKSKQGKARYNGLALGIAGDSSPNLLWRLKHGEMPLNDANFSPKVWFVLIGMNDLGRNGCSEEVTLLGILRVVEEILTTKQPNSHVVISGLLPSAASAYELRKQPTFPIHPPPRVAGGRGGVGAGPAMIPPPPPRPQSRVRDPMHAHHHGNHPLTEEETQALEPVQNLPPNFPVKRKRKLLLPSIHEINRYIKMFCDKHSKKNVHYFDASRLFLLPPNEGEKWPQINRDLMTDGVHPNGEGHHLLAKKIVKFLDDILDDRSSAGGESEGSGTIDQNKKTSEEEKEKKEEEEEEEEDKEEDEDEP